MTNDSSPLESEKVGKDGKLHILIPETGDSFSVTLGTESGRALRWKDRDVCRCRGLGNECCCSTGLGEGKGLGSKKFFGVCCCGLYALHSALESHNNLAIV